MRWVTSLELHSPSISIGPVEQNKISTDLASAIDIVTDIYETSVDWSLEVNVREDATVQKLTERHHAVVAQLKESISSGSCISWSMRKSIMQLFADILQCIFQCIKKIGDEVVCCVPYLIRNVMAKNKWETVLGSIDVYCDCLLWESGLRIVASDISSIFPFGHSEGKAVFPPEKDAPLYGRGLGDKPEQGNARRMDDESEEEIIKRVRQDSKGIFDVFDEMPQKSRKRFHDTYSSYVDPS